MMFKKAHVSPSTLGHKGTVAIAVPWVHRHVQEAWLPRRSRTGQRETDRNWCLDKASSFFLPIGTDSFFMDTCAKHARSQLGASVLVSAG